MWGGLSGSSRYQHATFSVNSICHMFGRQDYRSRDEARNNWLVALLVFGEGWHNNHHAFPASARHGLQRRQIDVSWSVIRGLEKLRLVWNVKVPDAAQLERRRVQRQPETQPSSRAASRAQASRARERERAAPVRAQRERRARAPGMSVYSPSTPSAERPLEAAARARRRDARDPGQPAVERAVQHGEAPAAQRSSVEPVGDPRREAEHALDARLVGARDRDRAAHREAEQQRARSRRARASPRARPRCSQSSRFQDLMR